MDNCTAKMCINDAYRDGYCEYCIIEQLEFDKKELQSQIKGLFKELAQEKSMTIGLADKRLREENKRLRDAADIALEYISNDELKDGCSGETGNAIRVLIGDK